MNKKIKVLVTGGTGFLGMNLLHRLAKDVSLKVIAIYNARPPIEIDGIEWVKVNLLSIEDSLKLFDDIDILFMMAAISSGAKDIIERPEIFVTNNTLINQNTLVNAIRKKVKHVIFPSCSIMYSSSDLIQDEYSSTTQIYDRYLGGATMKLYIEGLCKFYALNSDTSFTVIRQTNIYGPYDKFHKDRSHVLAASILKTENNPKKIEIWGDGEEGRDFVYVEDLIDLYINVIRFKKNKFDLICAGSEQLISIKKLVQSILEVKEISPNIIFDLSKPTLPVNIVLSNKCAKKIFNWEPKTNLIAGLKKTINWRNKQINGQ